MSSTSYDLFKEDSQADSDGHPQTCNQHAHERLNYNNTTLLVDCTAPVRSSAVTAQASRVQGLLQWSPHQIDRKLDEHWIHSTSRLLHNQYTAITKDRRVTAGVIVFVRMHVRACVLYVYVCARVLRVYVCA